jgi:hypothetical protein
MIEQSRPILEYTALIFFNLFSLFGFIAILVIIVAIWQIKSSISKLINKIDEQGEILTSKALDTMDATQEAAFTVAESGFNLFELFTFIQGFRRKRKRKSFIEKFFNSDK